MHYVYIINKADTDLYKIGRSTNPERRLTQLQTANTDKLLLVKTIPTSNAKKLERHLHKKLNSKIEGKQKHIRGEWYQITPNWLNVILVELLRETYIYDLA